MKKGGGSHFEKHADYVAWGELFNVSALAAVHPVMEIEQLAPSGRPVKGYEVASGPSVWDSW